MFLIRLTFFLIITLSAQAALEYPKNPHISEREWQKLKPYFLPHTHPIYKDLEKIFNKKTRVLKDGTSLKKAGFANNIPEKRSHVIVTTHKNIKGYIFKLYTDNQSYHHQKPEWKLFYQRIKGANSIRKYIQNNQLGHLFITPKKWLYPIPTSGKRAKRQKDFILIAEKMDLVASSDNYRLWKNSQIVKEELLEIIYALVTELTFGDGLRPDNLTFCKNGLIAFIDTQKVNHYPVKYEQLTRFLPVEMQSYWLELISKKKTLP